MKGKKKNGAGITSILILCILLLTGCGQTKNPDPVTVSTISVSDKGEITLYLVSDFNKKYYDISELSKMVMEEVEALNSVHKKDGEENPITVTAVEKLGGEENLMIEDSPERVDNLINKAVVTLHFRDADSYKAYVGTGVFYGTVSQAQEKGYDLDLELKSVKDNSIIGKNEILEMGKRHILILEDHMAVYCPGKVLYVSKDAVLNADGTVDTAQTEGTTYIIMK